LKAYAKRGFMLAFVLLAAMNLANFAWTNAASSAPSGIKDGAYVWYRSVDFMQANKTDYTYVEFVEIHEHTSEMAIRTGILNFTDSELSQHPPSYGYLDFESGTLALVGTAQGLGYSLWTGPGSFNTNTTTGFPPDSVNYVQVHCFVLDSVNQDQRSWYDQITGILMETSFLSGNSTTRTVILYDTNIPVGKVTTNTQGGIFPFEIPGGTTTYATLIGLVVVVALAVVGLVRYRKKSATPKGALARSCPACGYKNRSDATFCSSCGSSLAAPSTGIHVTKPEHISRAAPVRAAPVRKQEPPATVAPVRKPEPPVNVATTTREWDTTSERPIGGQKVCRTCGHVNPEWIRIYCVRCAARLDVY
jgi:hypothetical protein